MKNIEIEISGKVKEGVPALRVLKMCAGVQNAPTCEALKELMERKAQEFKGSMQVADINRRPGIAATRAAYKTFGKDPNRYRPSQEQLMRRILNGKELYYISNVVDLFNYVSIASGYSIGAFDAQKIAGNRLVLGVGESGEPYEGIGRGVLNIEGMPVYRDEVGGVGTPTSDNERTKIDEDTTELVVTVNMYGEEMPPEEVIALSRELLETYCHATDFKAEII